MNAIKTGFLLLMLEAMNEQELEGVLAHELAHIQNRDTLTMAVAATLAGAITYLSHLAFFFGGRDRNSNPIALLAMVLLGPLAAMLVQLAISRQREYAADAAAAKMAGQPLGLMSALEKLGHYSKRIPMREAEPATAHMYIVNPLSGGGLASLFSTHPPLEERIQRLQAMVG